MRIRSLCLVLASYISQMMHSISKEKWKSINIKNHRLADQRSSTEKRLHDHPSIWRWDATTMYAFSNPQNTCKCSSELGFAEYRCRWFTDHHETNNSFSYAELQKLLINIKVSHHSSSSTAFSLQQCRKLTFVYIN